jgi:hypothetical protein
MFGSWFEIERTASDSIGNLKSPKGKGCTCRGSDLETLAFSDLIQPHFSTQRDYWYLGEQLG